MSTDLSLKETKTEYHGTLRGYLIGFFSSLVLTMISFSFVAMEWFSGTILVLSLISLAVFQAIIQLICFLHLGQEDKPRWETLMFGFTVLVLLIIIVGSLWIMHDLDYRVMSNMHQGS